MSIAPKIKLIDVSIIANPPIVDKNGKPQLLCDDTTITLTCEANSTCGEPIYQWVSSLNYETFDKGLSVIKVELRSYPVNYSCIVTDGYFTGYANITIVSNGKVITVFDTLDVILLSTINEIYPKGQYAYIRYLDGYRFEATQIQSWIFFLYAPL